MQTLTKIRNSNQGAKFISLFDNGDISEYNNDESSADLALCNVLAFWLQGNFNAIDTAFRQSALYRPKWEREDYRTNTINEAILKCNNQFYSGIGRPPKQEATHQKQADIKPYLMPQNVEEYLQENKISIKFNDITKLYDVSGMNEENIEHLQTIFPSLIYSKLQSEYKNCSVQNITAYLYIIASRHHYNPVIDMLNQYKYSGVDYLTQLYEIMGISEDDNLSKTLILKWLWQCVSLLHNDFGKPFGAEGILVLTGRQGVGKTSLFKKLAIQDDFFKEGQTINFHDKDSYIRCVSCWIAELGEIESTFKSDVAKLKAFITNALDEYRRPYGRGDIRTPRRTSLCGTCNSDEFLIDTSGNRSFWTVHVKKIDVEALQNFNSIQLWKQIQMLSKDNLQGFRLSTSEREQLENRNKSHEKKLKGEDEIEDILNMSDGSNYRIIWANMTVTEFKQLYDDILKPYSVSVIGKCLDKLGYNTIIRKIEGKTQRLRNLPKRKYFY